VHLQCLIDLNLNFDSVYYYSSFSCVSFLLRIVLMFFLLHFSYI